MKRVKLLTEKQIQAAANKGPKSAALCSKRHWQELKKIGPAGYKKNVSGNIGYGWKLCALCLANRRNRKCKGCLKGRQGRRMNQCCAEYDVVAALMDKDTSENKRWSQPTLAAMDALIARIDWLVDRSSDD